MPLELGRMTIVWGVTGPWVCKIYIEGTLERYEQGLDVSQLCLEKYATKVVCNY